MNPKLLSLVLFLQCAGSNFCQEQTKNRFGVYVSPTLGLDYLYAKHQYGDGWDFNNDYIPLIGLTYERSLGASIYAAKIGFEPIFNWGSYYGGSFDFLSQIKFGGAKFKFDLGLGYMYREAGAWKQSGFYLSLAPEFRLWNCLLFEPSICASMLWEVAPYYSEYDGRFERIWGRLNIVYLF